MGGICSKGSAAHAESSRVGVNPYGSGVGGYWPRESGQPNSQSKSSSPRTRKSMEKQLHDEMQIDEPVLFGEVGMTGYESNEEDFYDGIPRFSRDLSQKSRSARFKQGSEVTSRLGRAGTLGLEKAVEVLDTLGSSMSNLNSGGGFVSGPTTKGNELSILAFEVANTIVKGYSLMQSLSKRSIRQLKEKVLPSEGVQLLVSKDTDELLRIVAADKREELKIFSVEVIRFGNRCKDPQWHNLDRYFEKHSREPPKLLKEEADLVTQQLMTLVQYTAELYHELHILDRLEQDHQHKLQEVDSFNATQRGDSVSVLRGEIKSQRKQVRNLKKKSLWSRSMEEVMGKLVDIVLFLNWEIHNGFGTGESSTPSNGSLNIQHRLGPAGLALHYANIVLQIDSIVARSNAMPPNTRDTLYQSLPPSIKSPLRAKLHSFHVKEELTVTEIKAEMEKTLHWLVPISINTAKAHHGFGWVGEWANTGSEVNRKPTGLSDIIRIDTLHHADKQKTEAYILELMAWLNHLVSRSKVVGNGGSIRSPIKSPTVPTHQENNHLLTNETANASSPLPKVEDQEIIYKERTQETVREIQDFESVKSGIRKHEEQMESNDDSTTRGSNNFLTAEGESSSIPVVGVDIKAVDVLCRVDNPI